MNNFLEINYFGDPKYKGQLTKKEMLNIIQEVLKETKKELTKAFLNITWCSREEMRYINNATRKENHATNVLSFAPKAQSLFLKQHKKHKMKHYFGDMCICEDVIFEECYKLKCGFKERMYVLFIHAIEHLLGYQHDSNEEAEIFEDIQKKVLLTFNYQDCYLYNAYDIY